MSREAAGGLDPWMALRPAFVGVGLLIGLDVASQYAIYVGSGIEPAGFDAASQVALTQVSPLVCALVALAIGCGSRAGRMLVVAAGLSAAGAAAILLILGLIGPDPTAGTRQGATQARWSAAVAVLGLGTSALLLLRSRSVPEGPGESRTPAG